MPCRFSQIRQRATKATIMAKPTGGRTAGHRKTNKSRRLLAGVNPTGRRRIETRAVGEIPASTGVNPTVPTKATGVPRKTEAPNWTVGTKRGSIAAASTLILATPKEDAETVTLKRKPCPTRPRRATARQDLPKTKTREAASRMFQTIPVTQKRTVRAFQTAGNGMLLDMWVMTLGGTDEQPGFHGELTLRINVGKERAGDVLYIFRYVEEAYALTECVVDEQGMITFTTDRLGLFLMLSDWDSLYEGLDEFIRENGIPNGDTDASRVAELGISPYDLQMLDALYNKLLPAE